MLTAACRELTVENLIDALDGALLAELHRWRWRSDRMGVH